MSIGFIKRKKEVFVRTYFFPLPFSPLDQSSSSTADFFASSAPALAAACSVFRACPEAFFELSGACFLGGMAGEFFAGLWMEVGVEVGCPSLYVIWSPNPRFLRLILHSVMQFFGVHQYTIFF